MNNRTQWPGNMLTAALVLLAPACATLDTPTAGLREARSTVRAAESDPNVVAGAPVELRRAADSLDRANRASANDEPRMTIDHYAYVATRQAQMAMAIGAAKYNEAAIRSAEVDRERARADIRALEAQAARADASVQRTQAAIALQQASESQQQADSARRQAELARQQAEAARQQASALQSEALSSRAQAADAAARAEALRRELAELEAMRTDRGRVVTLGDVLFEFNRAEVRPVARTRLEKLATFLNEFPERRVLIEGYTDNIGGAAYNEQLSARRAEAIRAQLALLGVDPQRMNAVGYGMDYPVASNSTDTNRALNRRVEVIISEDSQPVRPRR